jgi:hypothetical protein
MVTGPELPTPATTGGGCADRVIFSWLLASKRIGPGHGPLVAYENR